MKEGLVLLIISSIFFIFSCAHTSENKKSENSPKLDVETSPEVKDADQKCTAGDMESCYMLGFFYKEGRGVKQDFQKTLEIYTKTCDSGYLYACVGLATLYSGLYEIPKNESKEFSLYEKVCNAGGVKGGCFSLAGMYEEGRFVEKNIEKAKELYKKDCDGGWSMSCDALKNLEQ